MVEIAAKLGLCPLGKMEINSIEWLRVNVITFEGVSDLHKHEEVQIRILRWVTWELVLVHDL